MRELKFRAWNKHLKVMKANIHLLDNCNEYFNNDNQDVMQYTGLKDKNGLDIYEGDVVRILYTDWPSQSAEKNGRYSMSLGEYKASISSIGWIVFEYCRFGVRFSNDGICGFVDPGKHGEIEVIGNVWKNPELLQTKAA